MREYIIDHPITGIVVRTRNMIFHAVYRYILKPILFQFDPEKVHDAFILMGRITGSNPVTRAIIAVMYGYSHTRLRQMLDGIVFTNPVGLGAGFDKNGIITDVLPSVGFGFEEVGSITGRPCLGNAKPRLWRLKKSKSILVYYGLVNDGAPRISKRLEGKRFHIPIGTSIAKTNSCDTTTTESGVADYVKAFRRFAGIGDYFTINISCPNAYGGQPFHDKIQLDLLLGKLDSIETKKPVYLKISPDLSKGQINDILTITEKHRVRGFICSNLTKKRDNSNIVDVIPSQNGGMSGKVVDEMADDLISYIYRRTRSKYTIIGSGGIFTAEDAYKKIKKGASLVQVVTGLIFNGPSVVSEINEGLIRLMKKDGYLNISEAIGVDSK